MSEISMHDERLLSRPDYEILVNATDPTFVEFARGEFKKAGVSAGFQSFAEVDQTVAYLRRKGEYPMTDLIIVDLSVSNEFVKTMKGLPEPLDVPILFASASAQPAWSDLLSIILGLTVTKGAAKRIC
jgi:hypothetical protein